LVSVFDAPLGRAPRKRRIFSEERLRAAMSVIGGIWAAALTPVTTDFQPDAAKAIPYYRELLESGCDGINVLGTTGEAMSLSVERRVQYMRSLASSGLPMARMMAGTGAGAESRCMPISSIGSSKPRATASSG
jgi:hypothetical protein